ncbi:juvenile hormone esterase [Diabrotica virgifera virgifera]|uniref:Carboxylesterase type B domain-containing protein n=1 Tax=Diabrotica virgifera virgifera TaxID=50390 RepID=A0ABM5IT56_DIAVI|nr:juvenile hormone esterase [Diabrotica virgifera virgifera]
MVATVKVEEGLVEGTTRTSTNGIPFHSFTCIPYGKAPKGNLRFKAPQPVEPWQGVLHVNHEENCCVQLDMLTYKLCGSEDCLSLHVFTRKIPSEENKLKPVMVYIHGGGFMMGNHSTSVYGPEHLMMEDIVLVSVTYRVGILGFLSLSDPSLDVPGNAGLKDQALALRWVQRNIKYFNGDPNNVTLFGESAGGASVEYQLLSPTTKGLFHRAIIQSGSTLNPWARGCLDPADLANFIGKPNISEKELLKILEEKCAHDLYHIQRDYIKAKDIVGDFGIISPVVEKPNPTAFLTKDPMKVIQSGEYNAVPVIIGFCDYEGGIFSAFEKMNGDRDISHQLHTERLLPTETDFSDTDLVKKLTKILDSYYKNEKNINDPYLLLGDSYFIAGVLTSVKNQAKVSRCPIYLYKFTLDTKLNTFKGNFATDMRGAFHGDDIAYFFKTSQNPDVGDAERNAQQKCIALWTNFAKYGNPTPKGCDLGIEWKPIEGEKLNYLNIGEELKMEVNPEEERMQVWEQVYKANPKTAFYCN